MKSISLLIYVFLALKGCSDCQWVSSNVSDLLSSFPKPSTKKEVENEDNLNEPIKEEEPQINNTNSSPLLGESNPSEFPDKFPKTETNKEDKSEEGSQIDTFTSIKDDNDCENNTFLVNSRKICGFDYDEETGMTEDDKDKFYDLLFKEDADKVLSFDWLMDVCESIIEKGSKKQKVKATIIKGILDMGENEERNKKLYPLFDKFCFRKGFTVRLGKRKEFTDSGNFEIVPIIVNKERTDCCERRHLLCSKTSKKSITKKVVRDNYDIGKKRINLIGAKKKSSPTNKRIAPTPFKIRGCLLYNKAFANRLCRLGLKESGWVALTISSLKVKIKNYALYDKNPTPPEGEEESPAKYPADSPIWKENFWAFNKGTKHKCFGG